MYVQPLTSPAFDDLTARARIREAALALFAHRGFEGATIREIAEVAGVSPGLIRHHFGSKDALRAACDAHALAVIRRTKEEAYIEGQLANPMFVAAAYEAGLPVVRYLARALADGSAGAASLFDDLVAFTEQFIARGALGEQTPKTQDLHAYAAVLTAMSLGTLVLHEHLARALDADPLTSAGHRRLSRAMLEIYSQPLLSAESSKAARAGLDELEARSPRAPRPVPQEGADHD